MRVRSSLKWVFAFGGLALGAGSADAQPASSAPSYPDAQVVFQGKPSLTAPEMTSEADRSIAKMQASSLGIRQQVEKARKDRDVVKTLCLTDKLSQVDVAVKSAKERRQALDGAVERKDTELGQHQFTLITTLRQRAEQLAAEANQCVGEEAALIGATDTKLTVETWIPPDDSLYPPTDPLTVSGPPLPNSTPGR